MDDGMLAREGQDAPAEPSLCAALERVYPFVALLAPDGTVIEANSAAPATEETLAFPARGQKLWDCPCWTQSPFCEARLRDAIARAAGGDTQRIELPIQLAGNAERQVELLVAPLCDGSGRVPHLSVSAIDITACKEAEKVLRRRAKQAGRMPETEALPGGRDEGRGCIGALIDVTERRRAEETLRKSEAQLRLFVEHSPASIAMFDREMHYLAASRRWREDRHLGERAIIGHPHYEISPKIPEHWKAAHRRGLAGEVVRCQEDCFERQDGTVRWVRWDVHPWRDTAGAVAGIVILSEDITERKQAEVALREAARRKDEFLATLAHELRNPLAPIRNAVDILKLQGLSDPTAQAARDIIDRQSRQLVRLVDDLLDVNRIGRGKLQLRKEPVELADVITQALEGAGPQIRGAGQELSVSLPPDPIYLAADPVRLAQVFVNLLNNASKYTGRGGRIRLRARREAGEVRVKVEDTGIGIAPEDLPRIFDMFAQVRSAATQPQPGIGIGLALARGLVEMHGGRIEARSEGLGLGSAFVVSMPILDEALFPQPPRAGDGETHRPGVARRVLVVDDERAVAHSLAVLLRLLGHEVEIAHDGLEAIGAAERSRPDVILLDIGMPELDGYAACRRIREQPWGEALRIVALTGWGTAEDRRRSAEAGFDGHLVKPVEAATLSKLLGELSAAKG